MRAEILKKTSGRVWLRVEIFIKYLTESLGEGGDLYKYISRGMGEGGDRRNKSRFRYEYFNKLKLDYSNYKIEKLNSLKLVTN